MTAFSQPALDAAHAPPVRTGRSYRRWLWLVALIGVMGCSAYGLKGTGVWSTVRNFFLGDPRAKQVMRVALTRPADAAVYIDRGTSVTVRFRLWDSKLDPSTVNHKNVVLVRAYDQQVVPANVFQTSDTEIVLKPERLLDAATTYNFIVKPQVKDTVGRSAATFLMSFTTNGRPDPAIQFEKVALPTARGHMFTCVKFGPDQRLWASNDQGLIFRFDIRPDGTLSEPVTFESLQQANGGPRLTTGFCFDPASTPERPILWITNGHYAYENAPDLSCKVTRISGANLETVEDVVIGLPRSVGDHTSNQPSFGPDGALYWPQPSNTAFGAPDAYWGMRPEHLLNATILRLDTTKVTPGKPIDARTRDVGGTYDPFAPDAPLTIYAAGVRLAYDLCFANDGHLYAPVNGATVGGNAPPVGGFPGIENFTTAEDDWLFRIAPGKYHGHPNPAAGYYVLNGGNPTEEFDFAEVPQYPVGTKPEPDWTPACYVMGQHISANGVIQYRGNAFGGRLKDKLLICRYSRFDDIIAIGFDAAGKPNYITADIPGLNEFRDPLDIEEDPRNGNLYIAEFAGQRITLCRPVETSASGR